MEGLGLEAKLAILDQALRRLEGELQNDEHWRALTLPVANGEAGATEAAREARNTRLRLALETNPVYRAWKDVKDATESLRALAEPEPEAGPELEPQPISVETQPAPPQPDASREPRVVALPPAAIAADPPKPEEPAHPDIPTHVSAAGEDAITAEAAPAEETGPEGFAAHYELPQDIANLIRAELEAASARQEPASDGEDELFAVGTRATRTMDKLLSIPSVEPVGPEQLEAARRHANRTSLRAALQDIAPPAGEDPSQSEKPKPADAYGVPLDADDLAFLLSPTTAPTKASRVIRPEAAPKPRVPLMQRLRAEEAVPRPLAVGAPEEAEVTVVRRKAQAAAAPTAAPPATEVAPDAPAATAGESTKAMRLSQLLKAWTRP